MEGALALVIVALIGNLVVLGAILIPAAARPAPASDRPASSADVQDRLAAAAVTGSLDDPLIDGASAHAYDRVVRVVSWVFILVTAALVRGDRPVARNAAGDPHPARPRGRVPHPGQRRPAVERPGLRQVHRRGFGRADRRRDARRVDRRRGEPVLLHVPAGRRRGGPGRPAAVTIGLLVIAAFGYLIAVALGSPADTADRDGASPSSP